MGLDKIVALHFPNRMLCSLVVQVMFNQHHYDNGVTVERPFCCPIETDWWLGKTTITLKSTSVWFIQQAWGLSLCYCSCCAPSCLTQLWNTTIVFFFTRKCHPLLINLLPFISSATMLQPLMSQLSQKALALLFFCLCTIFHLINVMQAPFKSNWRGSQDLTINSLSFPLYDSQYQKVKTSKANMATC